MQSYKERKEAMSKTKSVVGDVRMYDLAIVVGGKRIHFLRDTPWTAADRLSVMADLSAMEDRVMAADCTEDEGEVL